MENSTNYAEECRKKEKLPQKTEHGLLFTAGSDPISHEYHLSDDGTLSFFGLSSILYDA